MNNWKDRLHRLKVYVVRYWDILSLYTVIMFLLLYVCALKEEVDSWHKQLAILERQVDMLDKKHLQMQVDIGGCKVEIDEVKIQQAEHRGMLVRQFVSKQGALLTSLGN